MRSRLPAVCTLIAVAALAPGCGGGGGGTTERTMQFGPLTSRVAGTVEPPVTAGESGLFVTGVAGGNFTALSLRDTSFDLDETRIVFSSSREGNGEIYIASYLGTNVVRLTSNAFVDEDPELSPDGTKIVFSSERDGNSEIYVMNVDGTAQTRLTNNAALDAQPSWSPDGTKIAFATTRDGAANAEIYSMTSAGLSQTRLTNSASNDWSPSWSPDGAKIAFASYRDGNYEIYTMNANGSGQTRLITMASSAETVPSWSRDGSKIAFASTLAGNNEIHVFTLPSGPNLRLTSNSSTDDHPAWSPDSGKIVFTSYRDGGSEIYTMNADGSSQTRLTSNGYVDDFPNWGPHLARRQLVGAGGSMGTNASGFIFGQRDEEVRSLVVFDAVTRTSARVMAQNEPGLGLPNVAFAVSADSLNKLAFINYTDTVPKVVTIVGAGSPDLTATDALVTFGVSRGIVTSVLPYTSNRSPAPTSTVENGARVFRGKFLGAWDSNGKNRAPNGAVEARYDLKTGELLSVR